ncbi:tyrosine-type recombinase/integrase [Ruegeria atlantica]|uniref:tyrosine-type recombinase/integrase n=1 Tax=Ruegeria atlantica TaxID=81569 RepID=UPI0024940CB7|nr:integrase family protein [Ruegeria atlantica]
MKLAASSPVKLCPPPGKSQLVVADDDTRNLFLIVGKTTKTWQLRFRLYGKRISMNLGKYPAMGLGDARRAANAAMTLVDGGTDPRGHVETVAQAWDRYWVQRQTQLKHPAQDRSRWDRLIAPVIGHVPLGKLTKAHFADLQDFWTANGQKGGQHGLIRITRHFQDWLLDRDLLDRTFIPRKPILPKGQTWSVPTVDETRALLLWCEAQWALLVAGDRSAYRGGSFRAAQGRVIAIALLILTGARRQMIMGLRWDEVGEVLSWKGERMKNGKAFRHPVSTQMQVWLDRIPKNNTPWCFPSADLTGPFRVDIDRWTKKAGFPHVPHALRKALATWAGGAGYDDGLIGLALSHTPTSVTSIYVTNDRLDQRREMLDAWGEVLTN